MSAVRFNTAAFTNLTRDHLDYHGTMEAYGAAKARLFGFPGLAHRVINVDDPFGAALAARDSSARLTVTTRAASFTPGAAQYVRALRVTPDPTGLSIAVDSSFGPAQLAVRLMGEFNVDNLAHRARGAARLGRAARRGGARARPQPAGERPHGDVRRARPHAARHRRLRAHARCAREGAARLQARIAADSCGCVFGCGGDRDPGKRPLMGRLAAELADDLIVTDDNPRSEDPARIVADILAGISRNVPLVVEHDRELAIRLSLARSSADDVVLIAGKGHEDYQILGNERRPFSDQAVVVDALREVAP